MTMSPARARACARRIFTPRQNAHAHRGGQDEERCWGKKVRYPDDVLR
jgi:hypothetical protein